MPRSPRRIINAERCSLAGKHFEKAVYVPPAAGKIRVTRGKGPQAVHVVGQDDPGVYRERRAPPHRVQRLAQRIDPLDEKGRTPVAQVDREKISRSRDSVAAIVRHCKSLPETRRWRKALAIFRPTRSPRPSPRKRPASGAREQAVHPLAPRERGEGGASASGRACPGPDPGVRGMPTAGPSPRPPSTSPQKVTRLTISQNCDMLYGHLTNERRDAMNSGLPTASACDLRDLWCL